VVANKWVALLLGLAIAMGACGPDDKRNQIERVYVPPMAAINADKVCVGKGDCVTFSDESTGEIDSWLWDFGDGSVSRDRDPGAHCFLVVGTYVVTLTVTSAESGLEDVATVEVKVLALLGAPSGLTASLLSGSGCGTVKTPRVYRLSWNDVPGATSYGVVVNSVLCCSPTCVDSYGGYESGSNSLTVEIDRCANCLSGRWFWSVTAHNECVAGPTTKVQL